ncbi:MAG: peptidoglycan-associated lipoprotein Pal [Sphingobium sp.]|nr:peptidoglycan-associated lipoprotein Pal [Sphingobium sp.]
MAVRTFVLMSVAAIALAGCTKKSTTTATLPSAPVNTAGESEPAGPSQLSNAPVPGSHADFVASVSSDRIFFGTDGFDVDAEDQAILRSQATWLARYPNKQFTIEGHCDERGSREYNIALGERRANAAKNYLVSLGIDVSRITVISYGKERPSALGSDEGAWAQNRRAVTVTID